VAGIAPYRAASWPGDRRWQSHSASQAKVTASATIIVHHTPARLRHLQPSSSSVRLKRRSSDPACSQSTPSRAAAVKDGHRPPQACS
jgi:hypothetical protein